MPETEHRVPVVRIELPPRNGPPLSRGEWIAFLQLHEGFAGLNASMFLNPKIERDRKTAPRYRDGGLMHAWNHQEPCWLFAEDVGRWLLERGSRIAFETDPPPTVTRTEPIPVPSPEPAAVAKQTRRTRPNWWDIAGPFVVAEQRTGRHATGKLLHKSLESHAGAEGCPFAMGEGQQRHELLVRSTGRALSLKTLQNRFADIRAAAEVDRG